MTDNNTEALAGVIVAAVRAAIAPRDEKIAALEARIVALEARPTAKDAGVWRAGVTYEPSDLVSHGGSGWICRSAHYSTGTEPSHEHFRLFVKKGRDAR